MRPLSAVLLAAASAPLALAIPTISAPIGGAVVPGGVAFTVSWTDSGVAPALADLTEYTISLLAGSNATPKPLTDLVAKGRFAAGTSVPVKVEIGLGASVPANAYFLKMLCTATAGGTVTVYSKRFTLSGMSGTFTPDIITGMATVTGLDGPAPVNAVAGAPVVGGPADAAGFAVPYTLQTGLTKFAPMQPVPPTAITATNTAPLWPTSGVVLAATFLPPAPQVTTFTQVATNSVKSNANTAAPASSPVDDMQKYLNRWKD